MNITRRQFGKGILSGIIILLFGRLLGACRYFSKPEAQPDEREARYWKPGDHLAG